MDFFLGQLILVPYHFAPTGTLPCDGREMSIQQNQALYSLLGIIYGGNGVTTFRLPDLRGRAPMAAGPAPDLTNRPLGETAGIEKVALTTTQMPLHTHTLAAAVSAGNSTRPAASYLADTGGAGLYKAAAPSGANLNAGTLSPTGVAEPHENRQPYLVLEWAIAIVGVYPSRE